ncbi:T9SS type A sorting domain-containing protein [Aurantibacillus circumpalustris]|uniref:T9SS type A sorting domain-containing protein n=1 Tax=Aurantibacillus circumpalustris TaxID=3036359 RepID=UPI00295A5F43|nr:T9SS type A sorting domain-containing protein [Aurantibacillus circumpalustris]
MKKSFTILMLLCGFTKAQITLENSYPATATYQNLSIVELVKSGYKYLLFDNPNAIVKLYNMNHSVFKLINLPMPAGHTFGGGQVSDSLFNTDNLVEVAYYSYAYNFSVTPSTYVCETRVVNENAQVLFNVTQGTYPYINYGGAADGYKLIVNVDSTNKSTLKQINVYSLVGGLPMHVKGNTSSQPTGLVDVNNINLVSGAVPNPSTNKTTVGYQFTNNETAGQIIIFDISGKELKRYDVDATFNSLELDNSDLPSGTYFYQLHTASGNGTAKKMVVIK